MYTALSTRLLAGKLLTSVRNVTSSTFVRNTAVLAFGTVVAQSIGIIVTPINARLFSPADYGRLAIYTAICAICATAITLRYEIRILLPDSDDEAKGLAVLATALALILGCGLLVLSICLPLNFREWIGVSGVDSWLSIAVVASIFTSVLGVVSNWLNRRSEYKRMSALRIAQAILAAASGLAAGYFGLHNGLLFSQLTALIISLSLSLFFVNSSFKSQIAISDLKLIARKHRSSPLYLLPTALLDVIGNQLPIFLITIWFSNELTGQYRMAYMLLALPGAIVGNAISQVFFQRLSNIWPDPVASRKLTIDTWKSMALMGIVPLAITMIFGERLFQIILGESWQEAGKMARILAPMAFSLLIFSPTSTALIVLRMEHHTLYFGLAAIIYRPLMLYIGYVGDSLYLGLGILVFAEIMQNSLYSYVAIRKMNATVASNRLTA